MSKMKSNILKNYKSSLILIFSIVIGGIVGLSFGEKASVLEPLGNLFLNLIFTMLIPLVFFSISSAIANVGNSKKIGKLLGVTLVVFSITAAISGLLAILWYVLTNPSSGTSISMFSSLMDSDSATAIEGMGILDRVVASISVNDFSGILTRSNMLATVVFSIIVGFAVMISGDEGSAFKKFLDSGSAVMMKVLSIIMLFAPIGLGCYFATTIGALGAQIATGFAKAFVSYLVLSILYFFIFFTIYAFWANRKGGILSFWKHASAPSITALATCSSAACIPTNIDAAEKMGVPKSLSKIIMPLGVNIHKDGSVMGAVFKIMFVMGVTGYDFMNIKTLLLIWVVALLVGAVVGAIPQGGAIGEMIILSIFGFAPETMALMLVIATIIDAPATLLNSAGNTVCTMVVSKYIKE